MNGEFVKKGGFEPNFVRTPLGEEVSRVRILGTVVAKFVGEEERYAFVTLDDGTDTIRLKVFKTSKPLGSLNIGDIVDVIGKVKEYEGERYLIPEVVIKVDDPNYEILRRLELIYKEKMLKKVKKFIEEHKDMSVEDLRKELIEKQGIEKIWVDIFIGNEKGSEKDLIKKQILDLLGTSKNGLTYSEILKKIKGKKTEIEEAIDELLNDGICYEPSPGRIKKV
jgi:RPA family protein